MESYFPPSLLIPPDSHTKELSPAQISKLYIVTVATESTCYFPYLKESVEKNGGELIVLGFGEKWKGFTWKYSLLLDKLKEFNKNDIVCFVDGYDVICTRNLESLKNDFIKIHKRENCKIIVGHSKVIVNNFIEKLKKLHGDIYFGKCNNINLNSGTYIGYVKDVYSIIKSVYEIKNSDTEDDQILLTSYCNKNKNDLYIDIHNELFLTFAVNYSEVDKYITFNNNNISYKNNNKPYFLHACGEGYLDNTIIRLGYTMNTRVKDTIYKKMLKKTINEIKNFFIKNIIYIFFFIFLIILFYILYKKYYNKNKKNIKYKIKLKNIRYK
jgi:hypothetical protein